MSKKNKIFIILIIIFMIFVIFNNKDILKQSKSLNFNLILDDISYIDFRCYNNKYLERRLYKKDVKEFIKLIDSLELIEKKTPDLGYGDYYFDIYSKDENNNNISDNILIKLGVYDQYIIVFYDGYDWNSTTYFIKNAKIDGYANKIFKFLDSINC